MLREPQALSRLMSRLDQITRNRSGIFFILVSYDRRLASNVTVLRQNSTGSDAKQPSTGGHSNAL